MGEITATPAPDKPFAERCERIKRELAAAIQQVDQGKGVLIFTDIIGGTSCNVAREVLNGQQGTIIAGVNLPMLLKAAHLDDLPPQAAADELVQRSRQAIQSLPERNR